MVHVEIIYIPIAGREPIRFAIALEQNSTVADALSISGIYQLHPQAKQCTVGIYSRVVPLDTIVCDGDRIELLRPLLLDPKEIRRVKARKSQ